MLEKQARKDRSFLHPSGGAIGGPMATISGGLKFCGILGALLQPGHYLFLSQEPTVDFKGSISLLGLSVEPCKYARAPSGNKAKQQQLQNCPH